jgi:hypothetical protein
MVLEHRSSIQAFGGAWAPWAARTLQRSPNGSAPHAAPDP